MAGPMKAQRPLGDEFPKGRGFPLGMLAGDCHGVAPLACGARATHAKLAPTGGGSQGESGGEPRAGYPPEAGGREPRSEIRRAIKAEWQREGAGGRIQLAASSRQRAEGTESWEPQEAPSSERLGPRGGASQASLSLGSVISRIPSPIMLKARMVMRMLDPAKMESQGALMSTSTPSRVIFPHVGVGG